MSSSGRVGGRPDEGGEEDIFRGWQRLDDAEPVFYRTIDPVRNLRLRVCVRRLYDASLLAPLPGGPPSDERDVFAEAVIGWQAKLFGPREFASYIHKVRERRARRGAAGGGPASSSSSSSSSSYSGGSGAASLAESQYITYFDEVLMRAAESSAESSSGSGTTATESSGSELLADLAGLQLWTLVDQDPVPHDVAGAADAADEEAAHATGGDGSINPLVRGRSQSGRSAASVRRTQTMRIVASVDIDKEAFRALRPSAISPGGTLPSAPGPCFDRVICTVRAYIADNLIEVQPGFSDADPEVALRQRLAKLDSSNAGADLSRLRASAHLNSTSSAPASGAAAGAESATALEVAAVQRSLMPEDGPQEGIFLERRTFRFTSPQGRTYEVFIANADDDGADEGDGSAAAGAGHHAGMAAASSSSSSSSAVLASGSAHGGASLTAHDLLADPLETAEALAMEELLNRAQAVPVRPPPPGVERVVVRTELLAAALLDDEADAIAIHFALIPAGGWRSPRVIADAHDAALRDAEAAAIPLSAAAITDMTRAAVERALRAPATTGNSGVFEGMTAWTQPRPRRWAPSFASSEASTAAAGLSEASPHAERTDAPGAPWQQTRCSVLGPSVAEVLLGSVAPGDADDAVAGVSSSTAAGSTAWSQQAISCRVGASADTDGAELRGVAHFNHLLEFELCRLSDTEASTSEVLSARQDPVLALTALERDGWGRVRVVGYGRVVVPMTPGTTTRPVALWRPRPSIAASVADFFLGGANRLVDTDERDADPTPAATGPQSRFGLETEETGELAVRSDVVAHRSQPVDFALWYRRSGAVATTVGLPPDPADGSPAISNAAQTTSPLWAAFGGGSGGGALGADGGLEEAAATMRLGRSATTAQLIATSRQLRHRAAAALSSFSATTGGGGGGGGWGVGSSIASSSPGRGSSPITPYGAGAASASAGGLRVAAVDDVTALS